MLRRKDFDYLKVFDIDGNLLGNVKDIIIDFYEKKILGFQLSRQGFKKNNTISSSSVISINESIIVENKSVCEGIPFSSIKDLNVIDRNGAIIGVVEDFLIDISDLSLKGLIISSGVIDKLFKGKQVVLCNQLILGEKDLLCFSRKNILFKSIPHNFIR